MRLRILVIEPYGLSPDRRKRRTTVANGFQTNVTGQRITAPGSLWPSIGAILHAPNCIVARGRMHFSCLSGISKQAFDFAELSGAREDLLKGFGRSSSGIDFQRPLQKGLYPCIYRDSFCIAETLLSVNLNYFW